MDVLFFQHKLGLAEEVQGPVTSFNRLLYVCEGDVGFDFVSSVGQSQLEGVVFSEEDIIVMEISKVEIISVGLVHLGAQMVLSGHVVGLSPVSFPSSTHLVTGQEGD